MKYGQQLEHESVPQWCLRESIPTRCTLYALVLYLSNLPYRSPDNLDYNSLKHEIKAHTSKNQATAQAVAIPGHQDVALHKFEDGLYLELCRQHERVHLFITSKADEISRRLIYLERSIGRWLVKCTENPAPSEFIKHQRRFIKYDRELMLCADDINALTRFANAQIVAFRKIIKKYKVRKLKTQILEACLLSR